jgi:hypothetical protein
MNLVLVAMQTTVFEHSTEEMGAHSALSLLSVDPMLQLSQHMQHNAQEALPLGSHLPVLA